jgi:hypothetical protein
MSENEEIGFGGLIYVVAMIGLFIGMILLFTNMVDIKPTCGNSCQYHDHR